MKVKKILPFVLLLLMAIVTVTLRHCKQDTPQMVNRKNVAPRTYPDADTKGSAANGLDRTTNNLFFTKHARCRMNCRHITRQEVKDILLNGTINYNKSDLQDPGRRSYAVEGTTNDGQKVRIIFAPKQQHLAVVTVIDLEVEYQCNCS